MKISMEQQFLPAVLEIQQTPPSPIGRSIIWLIVLFFVCSLLWASLGFIDIVSVASGKIIPNGHVKVIQPLEIGTVTNISVVEGQRVQQGESLIALDSRTINAEIAQLMTEQSLAEQQRKRLQWLANQQKKGFQQLENDWENNDPVLTSQWLEYQDRLNTLQADKNKRQAEYTAVKQQAEKEGIDKVFKDAGFEWREPGCSMCLAMNADKLNPKERCASTSNRNFEGRQGRGGRTHLVSPAMAAAAAIDGCLTDVRKFQN